MASIILDNMGRGNSTAFAVTAWLLGTGLPIANAQKMYWVDASAEKIQRADLDGSNVEDLVATGLDFPVGIALDTAAGKMYFTENQQGKILRADLDGSNVEELVTGLSTPIGIALDLTAGKMYWAGGALGTIQRADVDGSNVETIIDLDGGHVTAIAFDLSEGKMYFALSGPDMVRRADLDGSNVEVLVSVGGGVLDIALDLGASKMYWTDNEIKRADLDGSNIETVVTGEGGAAGIALDPAAGKVYWTNNFADKIHRANLDGSNIEDLVTTGLVTPRAIALDRGAVPIPAVSEWSSIALYLLVLTLGTLVFVASSPSGNKRGIKRLGSERTLSQNAPRDPLREN